MAHVRDTAQACFQAFAHLGSSHVDSVARSIVTNPGEFVSRETHSIPCIRTHSQLQSLMVKYSFSNRIRHLSRALPRSLVVDSLEDVERLTVAAYESMLGDDLTFDDVLRRRIIMPNRLGGVAMGASVCRLCCGSHSHGLVLFFSQLHQRCPLSSSG